MVSPLRLSTRLLCYVATFMQHIRQLQGCKSRWDSNFDDLNEVLFAVSAVRELTILVG